MKHFEFPRITDRLNPNRHQHCDRAFTLVEVLVVITVVIILAGLLLVALRSTGGVASRTASQGALKSMVAGYLMYTNEHKGRLLPGFQEIDDIDDTAELPNGEKLTAGVGAPLSDSSSWVWHLAPYVDDRWETFFADYQDSTIVANAGASYDSGYYGPASIASADADEIPWVVAISIRPSFGLNSIFIGGDDYHGDAVSGKPPAATRMSDVKSPSELIAFGPAAVATTVPITDPTGQGGSAPDQCDPAIIDINTGYAELRAPFLSRDKDGVWSDRQWLVGANGEVLATDSSYYAADFGASTSILGAGILVDRHSNQGLVPLGHLDGSTAQDTIESLRLDMARWSPIEYKTQYYVPELDPSTLNICQP